MTGYAAGPKTWKAAYAVVEETYTITVASTSNGSVTVDKPEAKAGDTVTITVAPNEGYELGSLTVTDANGNRISLTNAGDGKYTFTMPYSKVTVTANFTAVEEIPGQVGSFTDVNTDDWFAEAVQYMLDNEMMNGTSATTFGPNTTTTRGMIVTILYRLEGEPDAAASSFTDVASNMYYADAINWAAANGIVNGITTTTFGPDNAITREQMAAILYRYAQYKGYEQRSEQLHGCVSDQRICNHRDAVGECGGTDHRQHHYHDQSDRQRDPCGSSDDPDALL